MRSTTPIERSTCLPFARAFADKLHDPIRRSRPPVSQHENLSKIKYLTMTQQDSPVARLQALGITLPDAPAPVAAYVPARRVGNLLFVSGQIPILDGGLMAKGRVPDQVSPERATECARQCALNGLAVARTAVGSLDAIKSVVRVGCFVASEPGFGGQPAIANGASELLVDVFGDAGRHARAAVGSVALPLNVPVEIEFIFELDPNAD